jgi:hypothetical protein
VCPRRGTDCLWSLTGSSLPPWYAGGRRTRRSYGLRGGGIDFTDFPDKLGVLWASMRARRLSSKAFLTVPTGRAQGNVAAPRASPRDQQQVPADPLHTLCAPGRSGAARFVRKRDLGVRIRGGRPPGCYHKQRTAAARAGAASGERRRPAASRSAGRTRTGTDRVPGRRAKSCFVLSRKQNDESRTGRRGPVTRGRTGYASSTASSIRTATRRGSWDLGIRTGTFVNGNRVK